MKQRRFNLVYTKPIDHKARNAAICDQYRGGATAEALAQAHGLSKARVHQILHEAGLTRHDRAGATNGRDEFLGIELAGPAKRALRAEASRRGVSMSQLSSDTLREMLVACGYPLEAAQVGGVK